MTILTIAHGTYNNFDKFKKTFISIIKNLNKFPEVELLIIDDSDNDITFKFIKNYKNKQIRYFKEQKKSIDHAYIELIKKSKGKYVWWFGDDILFENSIARVLGIIDQKPDFAWLNSIGNEKTKNIGANAQFNGGEVIENIGDLLTNLSSIIWKKSFIFPHLEVGKEFFGNAVGFCYPQVEALSKEGKFLYIDEPIFKTEIERDFKNLWYDPFDVFSIHYFNLLEYFYNKKNLVKALKTEKLRRGKQILKGVIFYKYKLYDYGLGKTSFKKLFKVYYSWSFFWLWLPIILIAFMIFNIVTKLKKIFVSSKIDFSNKQIIDKKFISKFFKCIKCNSEKYRYSAELIECLTCNSKYKIKENVILTDKVDDDFYEGKYQGHIRYVPKANSLFSNMILWTINSGYLWYVKKVANENSSILELGCGAGVSYFGTFNTIGMDLSYKSMKENKVNYKFFLKSDIINNIALKSESMDLIVSSFFWEHIDLKEKNKCLKEINRVLKPNGRVIFLFDVETKNPLINFFKKRNIKKYNEIFLYGDRHIGYETIKSNNLKFESQGFKIEHCLGCEKTLFQSWSTFKKLSQFNKSLETIFNFLSTNRLRFLFYPYTFFLRFIDETIGKILPMDWSRIVLVVLSKKDV